MSEVRIFRVDLRRSVVQTAWTTVEIPAEWDDRRALAFLRENAEALAELVDDDEWEPDGGRANDPDIRGEPRDVTHDYGAQAVIVGTDIKKIRETEKPQDHNWIPWNGARWLCNGSLLFREGARLPTRAGRWIPGHGRDLRPVALGELLDGVLDGPGYEVTLGPARDGLVSLVTALGADGWIPANAAEALVGLRLRHATGGKMVPSVLAFDGDDLVAVVPLRREELNSARESARKVHSG